MVSYRPYPPAVHHSRHRITESAALALISNYLSTASFEACLHPDAVLTGDGPVTPSTTLSNSGLVLHQLKRVEAGLRGEHLGADLSLKKYGGDGLPKMMDQASAGAKGFYEAQRDESQERQVKEEDLGWQDKAEFEREQDIEQGELGPRNNAVEGSGWQNGRPPQVPKVEVPMSAADKDERKRRKKEKRKRESATEDRGEKKRRRKEKTRDEGESKDG